MRGLSSRIVNRKRAQKNFFSLHGSTQEYHPRLPEALAFSLKTEGAILDGRRRS